ncbi:MAG: carbohydrate ABC transporter permease [Treponema sp.]|jgi:raffinose/stachyose/melibiose transport system permease protein|nr:carbohydrate ABC transporter permease [Treponema sp.]
MDDRSISPLTKFFTYLVMIIFTFLAIYPIFWLCLQSLKTTQEYLTNSRLAFPKSLFLDNYPYVWRLGSFTTLFSNSVFYALITVTIIVLLSLMAGFGFSKIKFKITPVLHGLFIIGILLTIQSILVPIFLLANWVKLYNTRLGVLIPYIGLGLPMGVYLCTEFIKGIPNELVESARIDGAGYLRIFRSIVFPMCAPVAVTLAIITFTATWNEFILINILTSSDSLKSLPVGVARFAGARSTDFGRQFTGLVISLIPILVFYGIFRKQITKGVAAGAVKE